MGKDSALREDIPGADQLAFRALFDTFYRPLLGFFLKRGCSESESEDLVQETLLNAFRGFDRFRREASDATWMFSIAGNVWLNHLRATRTQKRRVHPISLASVDPESEELADRPVEASDSALDRLLENERRIQLKTAIQQLPEGRRHALHLRIVHGLKYREIALLLGIEVNTVKSQIFQAKRQLEESLNHSKLSAQPLEERSP